MFKLYLIYINWYWDGYDEGYKGIGQWSKNDDDAPYYPVCRKQIVVETFRHSTLGTGVINTPMSPPSLVMMMNIKLWIWSGGRSSYYYISKQGSKGTSKSCINFTRTNSKLSKNFRPISHVVIDILIDKYFII